jgi:hypothetical protein
MSCIPQAQPSVRYIPRLYYNCSIVAASAAPASYLCGTCSLLSPAVAVSAAATEMPREERKELRARADTLCDPSISCLLTVLGFLFIEGPWDRVHEVIGQAHTILHQQGIVRIQTDIRVGTR